MKTEDNQGVGVADIRGLAADNVLEAFREMDAIGLAPGFEKTMSAATPRATPGPPWG